MIDITPTTDSDTQVTQGDKVRLRWLLNAQVDPADVTIIVLTPFGDVLETHTGNDLDEVMVDRDGQRHWRYQVDTEIPRRSIKVEYRLKDDVNAARDTAKLTANQRLT